MRLIDLVGKRRSSSFDPTTVRFQPEADVRRIDVINRLT
jgi:hypothetical protein